MEELVSPHSSPRAHWSEAEEHVVRLAAVVEVLDRHGYPCEARAARRRLRAFEKQRSAGLANTQEGGTR